MAKDVTYSIELSAEEIRGYIEDLEAIGTKTQSYYLKQRIVMLRDKLAAAQPVQPDALQRLEEWRSQGNRRRWEISRWTNTATVTLNYDGTAYHFMQPTLDAAINCALGTVEGEREPWRHP